MDKKFSCGCGKTFATEHGRQMHMSDMRHTMATPKRKPVKRHTFTPETDPDWTSGCDLCGAKPVMPATGMCGPCSTGDASTVAGNW